MTTVGLMRAPYSFSTALPKNPGHTWVDQVESATGFLGFVQTLAGADVPDRGRTLEDYVRAPWALVQQHRQETPAWALFARLLSHAVTAAPAVKIARDADLTRSQLLDLLRE